MLQIQTKCYILLRRYVHHLIADEVHAAAAMQAKEFVVRRDVDGEALVVRLAPDPLLAALRGLLRDQVLGQRQRMYTVGIGWDIANVLNHWQITNVGPGRRSCELMSYFWLYFFILTNPNNEEKNILTNHS
jgi:hypothetical protein